MLESNASPSLSASDDSDYNVKCGILHDMLNILDLEGRRRCVGTYNLLLSACGWE
jgi:tubulin polyglutamylase TTLL9